MSKCASVPPFDGVSISLVGIDQGHVLTLFW